MDDLNIPRNVFDMILDKLSPQLRTVVARPLCKELANKYPRLERVRLTEPLPLWLVKEAFKKVWSDDVDTRMFTKALAASGVLENLKWAKTFGVPIKLYEASRAAAQNGHLDVLQWIYDEYQDEMEVMWPAHDYPIAAVAGSTKLELLKWLRARGCPWGAGTCYFASQNHRVDVVMWAISTGCPFEPEELTIEVCRKMAKELNIQGRSKLNKLSLLREVVSRLLA